MEEEEGEEVVALLLCHEIPEAQETPSLSVPGAVAERGALSVPPWQLSPQSEQPPGPQTE